MSKQDNAPIKTAVDKLLENANPNQKISVENSSVGNTTVFQNKGGNLPKSEKGLG